MESDKKQEIILGYNPDKFVYTAVIPPEMVGPLACEYELRIEQADAELSEDEVWIGAIGRAPDDNIYAILRGHNAEKDLELSSIDAETIGHLVMSKLFWSANYNSYDSRRASSVQHAA